MQSVQSKKEKITNVRVTRTLNEEEDWKKKLQAARLLSAPKMDLRGNVITSNESRGEKNWTPLSKFEVRESVGFHFQASLGNAMKTPKPQARVVVKPRVHPPAKSQQRFVQCDFVRRT